MKETISLMDQPLPLARSIRRLSGASWIDRFNEWVDHIPVPPWVFYLILWFGLILIESGSKWLDGVEPYLNLRLIYVLYAFYGVYLLAAVHYLDNWAKTAFHTFRPILAVDESEQSHLFYQLTTMPTRMVWLLSTVSLVSTIVLYRPLIIPLWMAMGFFHQSTASRMVDLGIFAFNEMIVIIFIYHTLRQLRWISQIHKTATRINLFQLRPMYSLSGLTARTAGILLLMALIIEQQAGSHGKFTSDPYALQMSGLFMLISLMVYPLLAGAVFLLPLHGLHQLLVKEKDRLLVEADYRLQAHLQELHNRIDARQLQDADAINHHLTSLSLEREILAKLPTWPWQPGTLNLILTAVLFPILLWVAQQLLERWAGF